MVVTENGDGAQTREQRGCAGREPDGIGDGTPPRTGRRAEAVRGRRQVARAADDELTVPMPGKDPVSPKISV